MTATLPVSLTAPPIEQVAPHVVVRVKDANLNAAKVALLGAGAVLVAASVAMTFGEQGTRAAFGYLTAYVAVLGIGLCALLFVMVHHVTRAGWSVGVRRLAENLAATLPLMLVLWVPILFKFDQLFTWVSAELVEGRPGYDHVLAGKHGWLNKPFFLTRVVVYFAVWIGLTVFFRRASLAQDRTGDPALSLRMSRVAAPGILLFALSITFAAFDWIMSLAPHWFSTIFGVCYFAGSYMAFFAFVILLSQWLGAKGYLREAINTEHYHDLAKLMFTFMVFWTYVNFSQYMLITYANLPEETEFFRMRLDGGWGAVGTLLVFGHFFVPFAFLMSRHIKRNPVTLAVGAVLMLVIHWVDMQFLVLPNFEHAGHGAGAETAEHAVEHAAPQGAAAAADANTLFGHFGDNLATWFSGLHWFDVTSYLGMLCLLAGTTIAVLARHNLLPTRDPRLVESLQFHNQ